MATLEEFKHIIQGLDEGDLKAGQNLIIEEKNRRRAAPLVREAVERERVAILRQVRDEARVEGAAAMPDTVPAWVAPAGDVTAGYLPGDRVLHDDGAEFGHRVYVHVGNGVALGKPGEDPAWQLENTGEATTDTTPDSAPVDMPAEPGNPVIIDTTPTSEPAGEPVDAPPGDTAVDTPLPQWQSGVQYLTGEVITHEGATWRVTADHLSAATNPPGIGTAPYTQA